MAGHHRRRLLLAAAHLSSSSSSSSKDSPPLVHDPPAPPGPDPAYPTHVATSAWQKAFVAGYAALSAVRDPERGDMVAALGETTGGWVSGWWRWMDDRRNRCFISRRVIPFTGLLALRRLRALMAADPVGRAILAARPDIKEGTVRPEVLRALPEGSFGREYARFMDHHGYGMDEFVQRQQGGRGSGRSLIPCLTCIPTNVNTRAQVLPGRAVPRAVRGRRGAGLCDPALPAGT